MDRNLYGGIELGGTKMVYGVGDENGTLLDRVSIPTNTPDVTLNQIHDYFADKDIVSLGIASFGPVDLNEKSHTYGYITTTPKQGWANTNVLSYFEDLNVPLGIDTDVNGACLGEVVFGAGKQLSNVIYGTIGTGIGFGVYINDQLLHGLLHPETGHMLLKKHEIDKDFHGPCPYHDNCLETLASGPAIEKRWHKSARELYDNKEVWELEAHYISEALVNCILCYSPERIILGGGVMHNEKLIDLIRVKVVEKMNNYIKKDEIIKYIDEYIVLPGLKDDAGIIGAIELGKRSYEKTVL